MKRGYYKASMLKNANILEEIKDIKSKHPFWGYRRIWAYLNYHKQLNISQNRVYRIMRQADLLVKNNEKLKATRTPNTSKPRPTRPNQWWGIDMTKIMIDGYGWLYAVIVIDWFSKKVNTSINPFFAPNHHKSASSNPHVFNIRLRFSSLLLRTLSQKIRLIEVFKSLGIILASKQNPNIGLKP